MTKRSAINLADWREKALRLEAAINKVVLGNSYAIRRIIASIFSRGHVILEGEVGVAKTTLLRATARGLGGGFSRVAGTEDLTPSEIIIRMDYDEAAGRWVPKPGPLLAYGEDIAILFFNEMNRARPQALAAILQAMEERTVEAFGKTYSVPHLLVFGDRNSLETGQTFEIIAAAFDRFFNQIEISVPEDSQIRREIFCNPKFYNMNKLVSTVEEGIVPFRELNGVFETIQNEIQMSRAVESYIHDLWEATRDPGKFGILVEGVEGNFIRQGASSRGGTMLARGARTNAWLHGRDRVLPEDVRDGFYETMAHRVFYIPSLERRRSLIAKQHMTAILDKVAAP